MPALSSPPRQGRQDPWHAPRERSLALFVLPSPFLFFLFGGKKGSSSTKKPLSNLLRQGFFAAPPRRGRRALPGLEMGGRAPGWGPPSHPHLRLPPSGPGAVARPGVPGAVPGASELPGWTLMDTVVALQNLSRAGQSWDFETEKLCLCLMYLHM